MLSWIEKCHGFLFLKKKIGKTSAAGSLYSHTLHDNPTTVFHLTFELFLSTQSPDLEILMELSPMTLDFTGSAVWLHVAVTLKRWEISSDETASDYFCRGFHPVMKTELMKTPFSPFSEHTPLTERCLQKTLWPPTWNVDFGVQFSQTPRMFWIKYLDGICRLPCLKWIWWPCHEPPETARTESC